MTYEQKQHIEDAAREACVARDAAKEAVQKERTAHVNYLRAQEGLRAAEYVLSLARQVRENAELDACHAEHRFHLRTRELLEAKV